MDFSGAELGFSEAHCLTGSGRTNSYKDLYSDNELRIVSGTGGRQLILSSPMSTDHRMYIKNFRDMVVDSFKKNVSLNTEWVIPALSSEDIDNQGYGPFTWESTFSCNGKSCSVKFDEDDQNILRVYVGVDINPVAVLMQKDGFRGKSEAILSRLREVTDGTN